MSLRITSWNVNSIRIRIELIRRFVTEHQPDIVCLQETKVTDDHFPLDDVRGLGFEHCYFTGQKSYNGMAVLSRLPLDRLDAPRFLDNDEKRNMAVKLPNGWIIHNLYVPAGGDIPDPQINPKFKDKLQFMDRLIEWSQQHVTAEDKIIILGDMNIAPLEQDVWSHKQLLNVVSHTPVETDRMHALKDTIGWVDTMREIIPASEKLYSWWSYRARDWDLSNRGRRLDHIWVTPSLKSALRGGHICRDARGWDSPSDHVPVTIQLEQ